MANNCTQCAQETCTNLPDQFRQAMSRVASAVHVMTTSGPAGCHATTVSAVCSVSLSPPTFLVCVARVARVNALLKGNGRLCINALTETHEEVAMRCAGMTKTAHGDRLSTGDWVFGNDHCPILSSALAAFEGRIASVSEIGTHSVLFVEVDRVRLFDAARKKPMIWHLGNFASLDLNSLELEDA